MSYSQAGLVRVNPPNVLKTAKDDLTRLYAQEKEAFPGQIKQAKQWSEAAEAKALAEIKKLKGEGEDWLNKHPDDQARLIKLEKRVRQWTEQGKTRLDGVLHPERQNQQQLITAHSLAAQNFHGHGRKNSIYGTGAMQRAGDTHAELATELGEGPNTRRARY